MSFQRTRIGVYGYCLRQNAGWSNRLILEHEGVAHDDVRLTDAKALYASLGAWLREVDPDFQEAQSGPAESHAGLAQEVADLKARVEKLEQVKAEGHVLTEADDDELGFGSVVRDSEWDEWLKGESGWRMKGLTYGAGDGRTLAHVIDFYGPVVLVERK